MIDNNKLVQNSDTAMLYHVQILTSVQIRHVKMAESVPTKWTATRAYVRLDTWATHVDPVSYWYFKEIAC
jgi:hypothetical protein